MPGGGTLVDTNVFTDDSTWAEWSSAQLASALDRGPVIINSIVYAELSIGFDRSEDLDAALPARIEREELPWSAAFLAGRCFLQHRRGGGPRLSPLPDFFIAAHAAVTGRALLTRDRPRHLDLLPPLEVITPL